MYHKMTENGVNNQISDRPVKLALFTLRQEGASPNLIRLVEALRAPFPYAELVSRLASANPLTVDEVKELVREVSAEVEAIDGSNPYVAYAAAVADYAVQVVSASCRTKPEDIESGLDGCDRLLREVEGWRHSNT
jgi:hypothetical protein